MKGRLKACIIHVIAAASVKLDAYADDYVRLLGLLAHPRPLIRAEGVKLRDDNAEQRRGVDDRHAGVVCDSVRANDFEVAQTIMQRRVRAVRVNVDGAVDSVMQMRVRAARTMQGIK